MTRFFVAFACLALVFSGAQAQPRDTLAIVGVAVVNKALDNGHTVDQIVPSDQRPYPVLTFNHVITDTLSAFDPSDSSFVIPEGVSFARLSGQAVWLHNPVGLRQLVILRKSPRNVDPTKYEFFPGGPVATQPANDSTTTDMNTSTSEYVPVLPGEHYALFPLQVSGGDLAISGGTGTVFGATFLAK